MVSCAIVYGIASHRLPKLTSPFTDDSDEEARKNREEMMRMYEQRDAADEEEEKVREKLRSSGKIKRIKILKKMKNETPEYRLARKKQEYQRKKSRERRASRRASSMNMGGADTSDLQQAEKDIAENSPPKTEEEENAESQEQSASTKLGINIDEDEDEDDGSGEDREPDESVPDGEPDDSAPDGEPDVSAPDGEPGDSAPADGDSARETPLEATKELEEVHTEDTTEEREDRCSPLGSPPPPKVVQTTTSPEKAAENTPIPAREKSQSCVVS